MASERIPSKGDTIDASEWLVMNYVCPSFLKALALGPGRESHSRHPYPGPFHFGPAVALWNRDGSRDKRRMMGTTD